MRVSILGKGGQLGRELTRAAWPAGFALRSFSHAELDLTQPNQLQLAVEGADVVINAAAYTAVDKAESEQALAFRVNRDGPGHLARACTCSGAVLLHVSTDYVFDGKKLGAYVEDDSTAPLGVYGESKAAGEVLVRESCERHVILRTSWVVSAFGHNFVKTMLRLANERDRLRVVADQFGRPTPAKELAAVLVRFARRCAEGTPAPWGTYHYAGAGRASWYDLACEVVELQALHTGRRPVVEPITTDEYPTPARRPMNSLLDTHKLENALAFTPERWQAGVADVVSELLAKGAP